MKERNAKNAGAHGEPPTPRKIKELLEERFELWNAVLQTATETGATWRWMYSDPLGKWSFRAYLPGERFFAALTLTDEGFEVSLNLKAEEWDGLYCGTPQMEARIAELRAKAGTGELTWVHLPVNSEGDLPLVASLFVARARRQQSPRTKPSKRRR